MKNISAAAACLIIISVFVVTAVSAAPQGVAADVQSDNTVHTVPKDSALIFGVDDTNSRTPEEIIREISQQRQANHSTPTPSISATDAAAISMIFTMPSQHTTPAVPVELQFPEETNAIEYETTTIDIPNRVILEAPVNCAKGYYKDNRGICRRIVTIRLQGNEEDVEAVTE